MIIHFINWVKGFFTPKQEESVVLEETSAEEKEVVTHCGTHTRFRKNCSDCLSAVGVV
jgi:3-mercaptopyruvate sulfurtransferase SseA